MSESCAVSSPLSTQPTVAATRAKTLKWLANICGLGGGAAMAVAPQVSLLAAAFVPFAICHILWAGMAVRLKDKELFWLNMGALALDLWAIVARL